MKSKIIVWNILVTLLIVVFLHPTILIINSSSEGVYATDHIVINEICYNTTDIKAWWIELYNPTNQSINITDGLLWFYSVSGPIHLPYISINPKEYVIISQYKNETKEYWEIPENVRVFEVGNHFWGDIWDSIGITEGPGVDVDRAGHTVLPHTLLNHSWARYKDGYDTDNFTEDFYDEANPTPGYKNHREKGKVSNDIIIKITIGKAEFLKNESIYVTVNITNNGNESIYRSGYCYTFILTFPNEMQKECFCPYNNTMGVIKPGESFKQIINLSEYSYEPETWKHIGNLPIGKYSIYAVYNSKTNPWYDESIPYNETFSNTLYFEISDKGDNNNVWSFITTYLLPPIIAVIIAISIIYILRRKRKSKMRKSESSLKENNI